MSDSEVKAQAQERFGQFAQGYVESKGHASGDDLERLVEIAQPQADWDGVAPVDSQQDLQPGDLLYFGSGPNKITHTGIYMGEGRFINATTHEKPMIRIDSLSDPYWSKILVAMRRVK